MSKTYFEEQLTRQNVENLANELGAYMNATRIDKRDRAAAILACMRDNLHILVDGIRREEICVGLLADALGSLYCLTKEAEENA